MDDEPGQSANAATRLIRRSGSATIQARPISRPERLSDQVIGALRVDVESGRIAPGSRLPSEKELTETFHVSRTVIREAIMRLQSDGLLVSRQGSGVYVTHPSEVVRSFRLGLDDATSKSSTRELYELRMGVESEAACLAAVRRTKADLIVLGKALKALSVASHDLQSGVTADVHFHLTIAKLSKNSAILRFEEFLASVLTEAVRLARENSAQRKGLTSLVLEEHVAVFDAIKAGDSEAARIALRKHLTNAQDRLGLLNAAETKGGRQETVTRERI